MSSRVKIKQVENLQNILDGLEPGGTSGQIQYNNDGSLDGANSLYYDDVNDRVGIGTTNPNEKLDIQGNVKVQNSLLSNQQNAGVDTGTETIATISATDYDGVFFDYLIKNGTNLRAGTITAVHDGTNVEFTETSTQDLGDTTDVELFVELVSGDLTLKAESQSDNWIVKSLIRAL